MLRESSVEPSDSIFMYSGIGGGKSLEKSSMMACASDMITLRAKEVRLGR